MYKAHASVVVKRLRKLQIRRRNTTAQTSVTFVASVNVNAEKTHSPKGRRRKKYACNAKTFFSPVLQYVAIAYIHFL